MGMVDLLHLPVLRTQWKASALRDGYPLEDHPLHAATLHAFSVDVLSPLARLHPGQVVLPFGGGPGRVSNIGVEVFDERIQRVVL